MAGNRKAAEAFILKYIDKLLPGSENNKIYKDLFASMNDKQFEEFITKIEKEDVILPLVVPNLGKQRLDMQRNFDIADELGHDFFQRIWMNDGGDTPSYLSNKKYLVIDERVRRQAQILAKKIAIPETNSSVDDFTGQPTGKSKGSKISYPETQILSALNMDANLTELLKYRGGDITGFNAMNAAIANTGAVRMSGLQGGKVKSTHTLKVILTGMHFETTL